MEFRARFRLISAGNVLAVLLLLLESVGFQIFVRFFGCNLRCAWCAFARFAEPREGLRGVADLRRRRILEDDEGPENLNAYYIAHESLQELRRQIARVRSASGCGAGRET